MQDCTRRLLARVSERMTVLPILFLVLNRIMLIPSAEIVEYAVKRYTYAGDVFIGQIGG
jgi:hypothetical protein